METIEQRLQRELAEERARSCALEVELRRARGVLRSTQQMLCSKLPCNVSTEFPSPHTSTSWRVAPPDYIYTARVPVHLSQGEVNVDVDIMGYVHRANATDLRHLPFSCPFAVPLTGEAVVERALAEGGILTFLREVAEVEGSGVGLHTPQYLPKPPASFPRDLYSMQQFPLVRRQAAKCTPLHPDVVLCMKRYGLDNDIAICTLEAKKVSLEVLLALGPGSVNTPLSEEQCPALLEGLKQLYTYLFLDKLQWGILFDYRSTYIVYVKGDITLREKSGMFEGDQVLYVIGPYHYSTEILHLGGYNPRGPQDIPAVAAMAYAQARGMQAATAPKPAMGSSLPGSDVAGPSGIMSGAGLGGGGSGASAEAGGGRLGGSSTSDLRRSARIASLTSVKNFKHILEQWKAGNAEPDHVSLEELNISDYIAEGASGVICPGTVYDQAAAIKFFKRNSSGVQAAQLEAAAYLAVQPAWGEHVPDLLLIGRDAGDDQPFLAVKFIPGPTLAELKEQRRLDQSVCEAALASLDALHHCNVQPGEVRLHGDVRLQNFILYQPQQQKPATAIIPATPEQHVSTSHSRATAGCSAGAVSPGSPMSPMSQSHSSADAELQLASGSEAGRSSSSLESGKSTTPSGSPAANVRLKVFVVDLEQSCISTFAGEALDERRELQQLLHRHPHTRQQP